MRRLLLLTFVLTVAAAAQTRPPVVLLNGYQGTCTAGAKSSSVFGELEQKLTAEGVTVYFFDNCTVKSATSGRPTIEEIGQAFGAFLASLNVTQVDVVAHSMGGLIVRAYLEGMLPGGSFAPPPAPGIRKAIFIATPHHGAIALAFLFAVQPVDAQLNELLPGSVFEWAINTANQRSYDFRGVDLLAIAGNGSDGTSDGAVPITSASMVAAGGAQRTRVIAACHVPDLPSFVCTGPGVAYINSDTHPAWPIIDSFLSGTTAWESSGKSASEDPVLSKNGGVDVGIADINGNVSKTTSGVNSSQGPLLGNSSTGVFFGDLLASGTYNFKVSGAGTGTPSAFTFVPTAGVHSSIVLKNGPRIDSVLSASGIIPTLSRAPGMLVAIYGASLSGSSVTVGGQAAAIIYNGDTQINVVLPDGISGIEPLTVTSSQGGDTVNLFVSSAAPAIFLADSAGDALAFHSDGSLVSPAAPAHTDETISIYATGLGSVPAAIPSIALDGTAVTVISTTEVSPGLYVIQITVPALTDSAASLVITSAGNASNAATLAVTNP